MRQIRAEENQHQNIQSFHAHRNILLGQ
jgi:hypothetical protein